MFALLKLPEVSRKSLYEAFFTIGGRILSVLVVIASTKFLTTFLSEADYGQLALYSITATLPSAFLFGPLGQGIMRIFPVAKGKNEIGPFHSQYLHLFRTGAGFILAAGVVSALVCWLSGEIKWAVACLLIAAFNVFNSLNVIQYGLQNAVRNRTLALGLETGDRVAQQAIAIGLLLFVSSDPLVVIVGYLLSSFLFSLINRHYYRQSFPDAQSVISEQRPQGDYAKDILRYSWPFIVFGIFFWFQNASDRWALALLKSTESVGQYAVLNQIGFQSLGLLLNSVSYFLIPILFNKAGNLQNSQRVEEAHQVNNLFLWFNALLTLSLFILFLFFGKEVIRLLSDEKYVKVAGLLPFMVLAGGLFNFGQSYSYRFMLSMQTHLLLMPKIVAAVVGCALNIVAVIFYGLPGLAVALILTQLIYVLSLIICWESKNKIRQVK
jgi:O-antigen/teichoic acid export membrane protein